MSSPGSNANRPLPAVDERLVAPESGYEIDDGKLVRVPPALEPHADRHSKLAALLETHVSDAYNVAVDMLTRTSETTDIAPDASVYSRTRTAEGGRQLEELAFEIASTESLGHAGGKAAKLVGRGVRRVFALDVERARVLEWSRPLGTWAMIEATGAIADPAFAVALPVEALAQAAKADDAIARALLAKRNPVIVAALAQARAETTAAAVLAVLAARGMTPTDEERGQILAETRLARLQRLLEGAATYTSIAELLA